MKQKALLSSIRTLWLASMTVVAFASMPVVSLAQSPKNFVEETEHAVKHIQNDQDEPQGERVFAMPYLTNNTHYKVISDIYSNPLYNVSEGMFCLVDNGKLTVWTIDGEYLFGPEWETFGSYGNINMQFDNGALLAKSAKKNSVGKEYYSILYKNGTVRNLDPTWEPKSAFVDGLAAVTKVADGYRELGSFFINTNGEKMASPANLYFGYGDDITRPLRCGMRAFETKDHKWGFMNEKCQVVMQPQWDGVRDFSEDHAWTFKRNSNGNYTATLIDKSGKVIKSVPEFSAQEKLNKTHMIGDVCDGKYYVYADDSDTHTTYYNLKGNVLATTHGGTSFYYGHALVCGKYETWEHIFAVDDKFHVTDDYPTYESGGHDIYSDELWKSKPFEPFGLYTIHSGSVVIDSRRHMVLKEMSETWSGDYIRGFSQPGKDGYIVAKNIYVNGKNYLALIKYDGEIAWLFGGECFTAQDLKGFIKKPGFDDEKVVVDCPPTKKKPKGPKQVTEQTYKVSVVCTPTEGGSASVVGNTPIKYGDMVSIKPVANKEWVATSIIVDNREVGQEPFMVTEDATAYVSFLKSPIIEEIDRTNSYQGNHKIADLDGKAVYATVYATMSKEKNISSPFGNETYGYLTVMIDPKVRYSDNSMAVNCFFPPMKIVGFQHEDGKQYLVVDGGSVMYHNLRITTNDGFANLFFNLMLMMDGFESGSIVPRRYRIEMLNANSQTGECTLGELQVFSRSKGWVKGQDKSVGIHTASRFPALSGGAHDFGIPADYFNGCNLKLAKKRDDVLWYPPLEWERTQEAYNKKVEKMKQTYSNFVTDCELLFGR